VRPLCRCRTQKIRGVEAGESQKVRLRRPSCGDDRHALSVSRIAREGSIHRQRIALEVAPDERRITSHDTSLGDGATEDAVRALALGDE
jgi:hypothetical protein